MSLACAECPVRDRAACAALSEEERRELAAAGRMRHLEKGETLFAAGERMQACATLVSGALKVTHTRPDGGETILSLIHPAGFVGELFQPFARYDVVAIAPSSLCVFAGSQFDAALDRYPALARALLRRMQEDLYASRDLLAITGDPSARSRVARALYAFAQAASDSPCHIAATFDLPMSRGDLAGLLGLTIESVSRALTRLEGDDLIRRKAKRGIEIIDPARLRCIVEGTEV